MNQFKQERVFIVLVIVFCVLLEHIQSVPLQNETRHRRSASQCNCDCGMVRRQMRVVGGNITRLHEFPWIAGLSHGGEYHCGAALISRKHLITAAHCVNGFDVRDLSVTLGDHDRTSADRFNHIEVRRLRSVKKHEHFDVSTYNNDIAILEMDIPISFSDKMNPVCLPNADFVDYSGRVGIIAGWGKTEERGDTSDVLRKVAVPVWSKQECYNSGYGERKISENMFCAGYVEGQIDACQGDSGGPLQLSNSLGDMEIIGVVSWGRGCARPNLPGIYTKVANYLHWIEEQLEGDCICQKGGRFF
ncbi:proclotting enzyme-like [Sitophilus oryzae]|uniref:Proclotting enzyme-like n=1 Tax=Sitophilus oryzae TaxID=7048 RepID=A0A6J2YDF0_SITOR|nr:proclotting enzyme-like [Sitophilus oryzae]